MYWQIGKGHMNDYKVSDLPSPPGDKSGWPWTVPESNQKIKDENNTELPRISVITPSLNQGQFLEETIRSVLLQDYPNLEYFIMDGGSSDNSVEIIRKYERWISGWVSEQDKGQASALNHAFRGSSGDILCWINSDDNFLPDALWSIAQVFVEHPNKIILGDVELFSEDGHFKQILQQRNVTYRNMVENWRTELRWAQPGLFIPKILYKQVGEFNSNLRYVFDRDYMCRMLRSAEVFYLHKPVARFRMHPMSKTVAEAPLWFNEQELVTQRYWVYMTEREKRSSQGKQALWFGALPYLSILRYKRDIKQAIAHISRALKFDWTLLFSREMIMICLMLLIPPIIQRMIRKFVLL